MSDENQEQATQKPSFTGVHAEIEHLAVTGHVSFAGNNSTINVTTGGDVAQSSENIITVGGVETTQKDFEQMVTKIDAVDQQFEEEASVDDDTRDAARHYLEIIKKLLTKKKKPNLKILTDTVESLKRLGPFFAGGIAEIFGEPLATQIIAALGESAMKML